MKFFCIGDEDTVRGFRLAGVEGQVVETRQDAAAALQQAAARPAIGILIITQDVAADIRHEVDRLRMEAATPIIVEVPGPDGPLPGRKTLREFVQEAVGIRVGQEET